MRSIQHVLWRGAMALSLLVLGVGGGVGLAEVPVRSVEAAVPACDLDDAPILAVERRTARAALRS